MRSSALGPMLMLVMSAFPLRAQSLTARQDAATPATSPLEGNWRITGDLGRKAYPAISMSIYVNGKQILGLGNSKDVCSNRKGEYGAGFHVMGEIGPDGTFSLRPAPVPSGAQLTFMGKVPAAGATRWDGSYTFKIVPLGGPPCVIDQKGSFTASLLAPVKGAFSGMVMRMFPFPIPQDASADLLNRTPTRLKLSVGMKQGGFLLEERKPPVLYAYLPLTGTIRVENCPCFSEGKVIAGTASRIEGEMLKANFEMDDQSELYFQATYIVPDGALSFQATVTRGRCHGLGFSGTLTPE